MLKTNPLQPPIPEKGKKLQWVNLFGSSISLSISQLAIENKQPVLIITPDSLTANRVYDELSFFYAGESNTIIQFPDWETLPYDQFSPHQDIISDRLAALCKMPMLSHGIMITALSTCMYRLAPPDFLHANVFLFKTGDHLKIDAIRLRLEKAGYYAVTQVREHGEFAVRGAIIDIFPMGSERPFRIDLLDNEIDTIRTFSTDTQRSSDKVEKIEILPAKEFPLNEASIESFRQHFRSEFTGNPLNCPLYQDITDGICAPGIEYYLPLFFEKTASLFDYVPENTLVITIGEVYQKANQFWQDIQTRFEQHSHDVTRPLLPPAKMFFAVHDIFHAIKHYTHIKIQNENDEKAIHFQTQSLPALNVDYHSSQPLQALENFLLQYSGRVLFCAESTGRREVLLQLFNQIRLQPKIIHTWQEFIHDDAVYSMTVAPLEEGFYCEDPSIALIAESQLFGNRIMQRRKRKETPQDMDRIVKDLTELQIGSPIVHIDHGVGRYLGLQTLPLGEQVSEYLTIEYAGGDKLYVPVSSLHFISRYGGTDPDHAPLHKLGTEQWQRAKRKAAEQLRDIAAELLDLYAKREAQKGFACKELDGQYAAFSATFPFEETPDQLQAINRVIADMASDKPMDHLVCGDVGFGKTEVAMRAAFVAVHNNKQVVILVPTTLLAQQHYQTFQDRFADWPVQIELLSRFRSPQEQQNTLKKMAEGKIDMVIGTHKLLQDEVKFKNLGLVIIDEEHRFGVQQKERLKAMRFNVDILTLTATPIPRTLNMAFAGVRDLSLITTPPSRRLSVKTFIHEYQSAIIQEAILREILRGGQVYFLHNEVATIEKMANDLQKLVPESRMAIAHGKMRERELEQVMANFYHRRFNVLVCSTIIESGIDVPSANTILINRADKFGLAQLHQLRGRVGRSHHQAYAYLLIPSRKLLTADAEKRLDAIATYEDLGVGFSLATHDLEIRGAGELLGKNQSGNMQEIGFTLYMDLLERAVSALKSGKQPDLENMTITAGPEIELQIPALIPEIYLPDVHLRLQFYKRIASAKTSAECDEIQVEMIDRFGLLPDSAKNLFSLSLLKQTAEKLGITKIEANSTGGKIEFNEKPNIDPMKMIQLIQTQSQKYRLEGSKRLRFKLDPHEPKQRIELLEHLLGIIQGG